MDCNGRAALLGLHRGFPAVFPNESLQITYTSTSRNHAGSSNEFSGESKSICLFSFHASPNIRVFVNADRDCSMPGGAGQLCERRHYRELAGQFCASVGFHLTDNMYARMISMQLNSAL
jgi:hypothetical protein